MEDEAAAAVGPALGLGEPGLEVEGELPMMGRVLTGVRQGLFEQVYLRETNLTDK